jgi:regulator of RNase E activity RraA
MLSALPLSTIEGAVARVGKRPRGEGVALPGLTPLWTGPERVAGYAVTVTMSTEEGFPQGRKENREWWRYAESRPGPKVVVARVVDGATGQGAACGVLSAHVLKSLGCAGFLTDGYVRDVEPMQKVGLAVAARGATLRHGNPHVVRFGEPVEIFGMKVATGDFVMAGREGAIAIPAGWLSELPAKVEEVRARVEPVLEFCRGRQRTADEIAALLERR